MYLSSGFFSVASSFVVAVPPNSIQFDFSIYKKLILWIGEI